MERLEEIVQLMESAQMPLNELLERYEEGTKLVGLCQDQLKAAEQRVETLTRRITDPSVPPIESIPVTALSNDNDVSLF